MDGVRELPGVRQVRRLRLHPEDVGEGGGGEGLGDGVGDSSADLVVALRGLGELAVPGHLEAEVGGSLLHSP